MSLPILGSKDLIVEAVRSNQVTVVVGETGSGKTTQIPVFLYEAGLVNGGKLGVTQPRRIAAISVAEYVAKQLDAKMGDVVGYQIRFEDTTMVSTKIKFMTDGILLRELQVDPDLKKYSVIVIDEAHERSQNIDFTLGLLKDLLKRRGDLKVVVTSATIDQEKFSKYFNGAPIINVSGRTYPVEVIYSEINYNDPEKIMDKIVEKIFSIHLNEKEGDILVFVAGGEHIDAVINNVVKYDLKDLIILPAHGSLSPEEQKKIFDVYPGKRKVVVATNIAETSITLDGVVYVIDSGLIKETNFHPETGIQSLDLVNHSKAGCDQRKGRAGRTKPGVCYRMYTEDSYTNRSAFTKPEIMRTSLANVVLMMEAIGIDNIIGFDFIDKPKKDVFEEAYETLIALGAIKRGEKGLTALGKEIAKLPLEPHIARMVLEAEKYQCVEGITTIASFLSARMIFARPRGNEDEADYAHSRFKNPESDALTFLTVWEAYKDSGFSNQWCFDNFLNVKALQEVKKIREQLLDILVRCGIDIKSQNRNPNKVMKAVAMGLVYNLFMSVGWHEYTGVLRTADGIFIHPGSSVFGGYSCQCFVTAKILRTSKDYAHIVTKVNLAWLPDMVPHLCSVGDPIIFSYEEEREVVVIKQSLHLREKNMGDIYREISIDEARAIQGACIIKAEEEGWLPLIFKKRKTSFGIEEAIAEYDGETLKLWDSLLVSKIEEDAIYYCAPREFMGDKYAEYKFKIFNFPEKTSEEITNKPSNASLKELARRFNNN